MYVNKTKIANKSSALEMDCCFAGVNHPLSNKAPTPEINLQISSPWSSSNIVYVISVSIAPIH